MTATPEEREAIKARMAELGATARGVWEALLAAPTWTIHDVNNEPPPPLWHTRVTITESEM